MFQFYFVDHITGWFIFLLQAGALLFAWYQYKQWSIKKAEEDKHHQLKALHESVLMLKFSLLEVHKSLRAKLQVIYKEGNGREEYPPFKIYSEHKKLYKAQVTKHIVEIETKSEILHTYYKLHPIRTAILGLIIKTDYYESYLYYIYTELVDGNYPERELMSGKIDDKDSSDKTNTKFEERIESSVEEVIECINHASPLVKNE